MTLFQYDSEDKFYKHRQNADHLLKIFYETQTDFGEFIFLGLKRNNEVNNYNILMPYLIILIRCIILFVIILPGTY